MENAERGAISFFFYLEEKLQSSFNRLMANLFKREARMIDLENKF